MSGKIPSDMNREPPAQDRRFFIPGVGIVRVFAVTGEAIREAAAEGRRLDIGRTEETAQAALLWLRVIVATRWLRDSA